WKQVSLLYRIVSANLLHRLTRTLLSGVAIGLGVTMILALVGLSHGMLDEQRNRARGAGADLLVLPPGMSAIGLSSAPMPEKLVDVIRNEDHVILATGAVIQPLGGVKRVTGIDLRMFEQMSGGFRFLAGGPFQGPHDAIIDEYYARQENLSVGDSLDFLDHQWRVCGIVEPGKMARVLLPIHTLQELIGATDRITMVYAKLDDPAHGDAVIATLKQKLPGYQVYSIDEFVSQFSVNHLPELQAFIGVIIALSVGFGFLIIFLTMHTAVLERTREIGILKSLGASPGYILRILISEAMALAVLGTVLGIAASFGTRELIRLFIPASMQQSIVLEWWLIAAGITLCGALLGVLYPAYKAARQDVLESLSYD
ncbi:MAG: FtsX-like permease family protein, partial [Bryobacterales bacterium]